MQIQELIFFVSSPPAMYTVDFIKQYELPCQSSCFIKLSIFNKQNSF